jgi:23S rRNA (adenine1618-N6)-methyltransferase
MHPKNAHQARYDFKALVLAHPPLQAFVIKHPKAGETIEFADPLAVRALNQALLKHHYKVAFWELPAESLCPAIPGRVDMIHHLAELLPGKLRVLDVGVGASCIYPLLGLATYGWSFVGSDISAESLASSQLIVEKNQLQSKVELRLQKNADAIFQNIIRPDEKFDLTICNPPFFSTLAEARAESERKWKHLGLGLKGEHRNFGGVGAELWCPGGEARFLQKMVEESREYKQQVKNFSTLVSKEGHLKALDKQLEKAGASEFHIVDMQQGQKKSRLALWRY